MSILLDTNVIVAIINSSDPLHRRRGQYLDQLIESGEELCIAPQILFEFWVVATRPVEQNGLALAPGVARQKVDDLLAAFSLLPDPPDRTARWLGLCTRYSVRGRAAHDTGLVAWMLGHEVRRIVTIQ